MIRNPVGTILAQHTSDAAVLRNTRSFLVRAPHVKLDQLARLDERLAGHLDGLDVAGDHGAQLATAALASPGCAEVFVATVVAISGRDPIALERLFALVEAVPDLQSGLVSAFGWVPGTSLQGITSKLLASSGTLQRLVGLAACGMHGVDPGDVLDSALTDPDARLRARAICMVAQIGEIELLPVCIHALSDIDPACLLEAARAAVLMGREGNALAVLEGIGLVPGPSQWRALDLLLKVLEPAGVHAALRTLAQDPAMARLLIRGIGVGGDPHYLPWLIRQMHDPKLARVAGESLSLITGLDLAQMDLERSAPPHVEAGPNDDPEDDDVAMDEDDGLPWPDAEKIDAWFEAEGHRFEAGTRYFMGEPPNQSQCLNVLRHGFQRQRSAAAVYLCLLKPGTPLFNTAAPALRQQDRLAAMGE